MSKSTQTHGLKWMNCDVKIIAVLGSPWRLSHPKNVCDWVHLHNKHLQKKHFKQILEDST